MAEEKLEKRPTNNKAKVETKRKRVTKKEGENVKKTREGVKRNTKSLENKKETRAVKKENTKTTKRENTRTVKSEKGKGTTTNQRRKTTRNTITSAMEIRSGFKIASFHLRCAARPISYASRLITIPIVAELKIRLSILLFPFFF